MLKLQDRTHIVADFRKIRHIYDSLPAIFLPSAKTQFQLSPVLLLAYYVVNHGHAS